MDPTLARGYKNQFFREVQDGLARAIQGFRSFLDGARPKLRKRNHRHEIFELCVKQLGDYLLHHCVVGGKRHPFLCLYVFEDEPQRAFNTWNEKCLGSCAFILSPDPFNVFVRPIGFNISEHAVQRIFERTISGNVPLSYQEQLRLITDELRHAPLLCAFWTIVGLLRMDRKENAPVEVLVPTPQGLLLGTLSPSRVHLCELRTFVSYDQLFEDQRVLRSDLLALDERFRDSPVAFYLLSLSDGVPTAPGLSGQLLIAAASVLRATGHADLIPG
jgi:hypothetical protein